MTSYNFLMFFLIAAFLGVCILFAPHLSVFVLVLVFGVIFSPVNRYLQKRMPKMLAAFLTTLLVVLVILGPVTFVLFQIVREATMLAATLGDSTSIGNLTALEEKVRAVLPLGDIDLVTAARSAVEWILAQFGSFFSSALAVGLNIFLTAIALVYWFMDSGKARDMVLQKSPLGFVETKRIMKALWDAINSIIKGTLVIAFLQGVIASIGFAIFGVPNVVLWGTVAAIAALVPTLGTAIVLVPIIAYLFILGHVPQAIGLAIWGVLAVGLIDNILGPRLMARGTPVHPFFILMGVIGGVGLLGPVGLFAGPLIVCAFFVLLDTYGIEKGEQLDKLEE